jgi:hypothetical protein
VLLDRAAAFGDRLCGTTRNGGVVELRCFLDNGGSLQQFLVKPLGSEASVKVRGVTMTEFNVVVVGEITANTMFGTTQLTVQGTSDAFISMIALNGDFRATEQLHVNGRAQLEEVEIAGANMFATGDFAGTLPGGTLPNATIATPGGTLVARFNHQNSGFSHVWSKGFRTGPNFGLPTPLAVDDAGNVVRAFALSSFTDFGGGDVGTNSANWALASFDASGNHLWSRLPDVRVNALLARPTDILAVGYYLPGPPNSDGMTPFGAGQPFPLGNQGAFIGRLEKTAF